jgi:uncharacterized C2H2 Zn-finger protein
MYISVLCVVSGFLKSIDYHQIARHTLNEIVDGGSAVEHKTEVNSWSCVAREMNFPCLRCGSIYKYKRDWTRHVKFECDQKPQFCCTHCVSCFTRKSSLMRHIIKFHHVDLWSCGSQNAQFIWMRSYLNIVCDLMVFFWMVSLCPFVLHRNSNIWKVLIGIFSAICWWFINKIYAMLEMCDVKLICKK